MHFWLPVLLVEGLVLWLIGREPAGGEVADAAIGRSILAIVVGGVFVAIDVVVLTVRNW